ncbi:MAG: hypothetical protein ACRYFX_18765 [Janthinobacterium lividum]
MYRNSKRYAAGEDAALYLAVAELAISSQAERVGVGANVVRTLAQLSALRAGGATVYAADLERAGLGTSGPGCLAECKRQGWVSSVRGSLDLLPAGRVVVAELTRAWERARKQLAAFAPASPYRPARRQGNG